MFPDKSVEVAFEESVAAASWLTAAHSATVQAGRVLARRIDEIAGSGFIDDSGKLDNVSVPTFLRYCAALGFVVEVKPKKEGESAKARKLRALQGGKRTA